MLQWSFVRVCDPNSTLRNGNVIAIREEAGLVYPLSGADASSYVFLPYLSLKIGGDFDAYRNAILKRYSYFERESELLKRLAKVKMVILCNIKEAMSLRGSL
jgi:hypothetical protein